MKASNAEKQIIQKLISKSPEDEEGMYSRDSAASQRFSVSSSLPFPPVHFLSQIYLLN